jgi:hypothetical protein
LSNFKNLLKDFQAHQIQYLFQIFLANPQKKKKFSCTEKSKVKKLAHGYFNKETIPYVSKSNLFPIVRPLIQPLHIMK